MADWQKYPAFWPRGLEDRVAALREALEVARGKHGHAVAVAAIALLELAEELGSYRRFASQAQQIQ